MKNNQLKKNLEQYLSSKCKIKFSLNIKDENIEAFINKLSPGILKDFKMH